MPPTRQRIFATWRTQLLQATLLLTTALPTSFLLAASAWNHSYNAGYQDRSGQWAGGSEIMHLVSHQGKVFAGNGYWVDSRWVIPPDGQKQSAQVLRLDQPNDSWQVDLDTGRNNEYGLQYMKGNILKSVTFTRDTDGKPLATPARLLVMASGAVYEGGGAVSSWIRDDQTGEWDHTLIRHGSNAGGVRWVPRDLQIHRDKVTGQERLFILLGNPGILSGVFDSAANNGRGGIRWDRNLEYPFPFKGSMKTRPLGLVVADDTLYFSEGASIYRRNDGPRPSYTEIFNLHEDSDTDIGGIRGLTAIKNPQGPGESLLFLWAKAKGSTSDIMRLDPAPKTETVGKAHFILRNEVRIADLMSDHLGLRIPYTLGAHNMMYPVTHPENGETVHIIGFQGNLAGSPAKVDPIRWAPSRLYAGALYAIRTPEASYSVQEVNNPYTKGKPALIAPRAFCLSPFNDNHLYIGGHDASRHISDNMAWIFNARLDTALGIQPAADAPPPGKKPAPEPRLRQGPIYELRIYHANEDRFEHLIERFQHHTDRLFRKHHIEPLGYFVPTEGTAKQRRTLVYLLEHPSRYDAYLNWNAFTIDREWERVLDQPRFQRLLSQKPTSIFMTAAEDSRGFSIPRISHEGTSGGIYELQTHTITPERIADRHAQWRKDQRNAFHWRPFDQPLSENTLFRLVRHPNREPEADATDRMFLRPLPFSKLQ